MILSRNQVIGLLSFLTLIDLFGAQALLPDLSASYGVDAAAMGVAVNASTLGMAVAGLGVAFFSRAINRKLGIWVSLALLSVPTFLLGVVDDLTVFTWLRIAQGVLMSTAFTLTMAYLAEECSAQEAAGAMAAYITGNVVSNLLGRLLAANFAEFFGLSGSFWAFAALNLLGAGLAAHCLTQTTPREATGPAEHPLTVWRQHLVNTHLQTSFTLGFLILFVFLGVFTYVNYVLAAAPFSLSNSQLGFVYLVFLPAVFTTPFAAHLVSRLGVRKAFVLSMGVAAAGMVLSLSPSLILVLTGLAMIGMGTFCAQAAVTGYVGASAETERAAASGLYLASYYLGGLVGAYIIGLVFSDYGWLLSIAALLAVTVLSLLIAFRLPNRIPA